MPKLELWHKVLLIVALMFGGFFFLDKKWDESQAVAEVKFCAFSNKEMYLKMKLDDLCKKYYGRQYPCLSDRMDDSDKADFIQWEGWYKNQQEQTKKFFGGG